MWQPPPPAPGLSDSELAAALALGAASVLRSLRHDVDAGTWRSGTPFSTGTFRDDGDAHTQAWLDAALTATRPKDAVLSEEGLDDLARLSAERVWIIDPLDGTREFGERDSAGNWRDDFGVHIALWERGALRPAVATGWEDLAGATGAAPPLGWFTAGAVAFPARGELWEMVELPGLTEAAPTETPLRLAVSRSRPPALVQRLADTGQVELVPQGSAGIKILSVVSGFCDAYVHGGGQYEWDSAAPVAIAASRGIVCSRLNGSPLWYNQPDPYLPDIIVARAEKMPLLWQLITEAS